MLGREAEGVVHVIFQPKKYGTHVLSAKFSSSLMLMLHDYYLKIFKIHFGNAKRPADGSIYTQFSTKKVFKMPLYQRILKVTPLIVSLQSISVGMLKNTNRVPIRITFYAPNRQTSKLHMHLRPM